MKFCVYFDLEPFHWLKCSSLKGCQSNHVLLYHSISWKQSQDFPALATGCISMFSISLLIGPLCYFRLLCLASYSFFLVWFAQFTELRKPLLANYSLASYSLSWAWFAQLTQKRKPRECFVFWRLGVCPVNECLPLFFDFDAIKSVNIG